MAKRYTYQDVKEFLANENYELLSSEDEIINEKGFVLAKTKLKIKCPSGHITDTMNINNFKSGKRCRKCADKQLGQDKKHSYEYIKEYIESFGYVLLSSEYKDAREHIIVQCDKQHEPYPVTFGHFKDGTRCPECKGDRIRESLSISYEEVKEYFELFEYELLSEEYKNAVTSLTIKCPNGHITDTMTYGNFKAGHRCKKCRDEKNGKDKIRSYDFVKEYIEKFGYRLLSTSYEGCNKHLIVQCNKKHKPYKVTFNNFKNNERRCPYCHISKGERRIIEWLDKNNINYIYEKTFEGLVGVNDGYLSYDFYLLDYNLLIEYQGGFHDGNVTGNYKNTFNFEKQQEHDKRKREYADNNNIKLLEIWYWDFDNIENILKLELK